MILPIVAYGCKILRQKSSEIDKNYPDLKKLIDNMFDTMKTGNGVGLSTPQINQSVQLFVIDGTAYKDDDKSMDGFVRIMLNPKIIEKMGEITTFNEGCLSIPGIHEDIKRASIIRIQYFDENFKFYDEIYQGMAARIMQHEIDHLNGILFIDYCNSLKKRLLRRKLIDIAKGKVDVKYKMIFP